MIDLNHSRNLAERPRAGCFQVLFLLPVMIIGFVLMTGVRVTEQTFTVLHEFMATSTNSLGVYTNSDGVDPIAGLILSANSNTLYGATLYGGSSGNGTVFKVNTDGTGFSRLYSFTASSPNSSGVSTNSDGASPNGLILSSNTLYGTADW